MHDFIHTRWYQEMFAEPAPYRWLWRMANTWIATEELERVPEHKRRDFVAARLLCIVHEPSYRKRRRMMRSKVKYTAYFHRNKQEIREKLLERDGDKCTICRRPLKDDLSIDHIDNTVLEDGSLSNELENMRLTHALCNSRRGARQNRTQNKAWKKATRAIASIHGGDPRMFGRADRPPRKRRSRRDARNRHSARPHGRSNYKNR